MKHNGYQFIDNQINYEMIDEFKKLMMHGANYSQDHFCNTYFSLGKINGSIIIAYLNSMFEKMMMKYKEFNTDKNSKQEH
mmetsp:Transcript_35620/g.41238  ORF Transcript_35620/g.41238 Transcript_35620/m.41238 type:complete len:80 (+) Transcript_35620:519-758(+)